MEVVKSSRKLLVLLLAVSATVISALLVGLAWPRLLAEYHCLRIERAATSEESRAWLEALALVASRPEVAEAVVGKLGTGRQELTYRFFEALDDIWPRRIVISGSSQPSLGPLLPVVMVRAFCQRARLEPELLILWTHFQRWRDETGDPTPWILTNVHSQVIVESFSVLSPVVIVEEELDLKEARLLLEDVRMRGQAWFWGMPSIPEVSDPSAGEKQISEWLRDHQGQLRFDEGLGRFVLGSGKDPEEPPSQLEIPPRPAAPFPGWRGRIPEGFPETPRPTR